MSTAFRPVGRAAIVPVIATGVQPADLRPVPSSIVLQPTGMLPGGRLATGAKATFELVGLDAEMLLGSGQLNTRGLLRSSDGHTVTVRISTKHRHGELQPEVRLVGHADAGTYTGSIPLSDASQSPTVLVTVTARDAIFWALAAVALGTVLGGLLPLLGKRARKRNILRARLQGILLEYFSADSADSEMRWLDLSSEIGSDRAPWTSTEWLAEPSLHGAAGLFSQLRWAQSEEDLQDLDDKIRALIAKVAGWLAFQTKVSLLSQLEQEKLPAIAGKDWSESSTAKASDTLRQSVAWEPPAEDGVKAKLILMAEQAYWHGELAQEWEMLAKAWDKLGPTPPYGLLGRLLCAPSPASPAGESPANMAALSRDLRLLRQGVDAAIGPLGGKAPKRRERKVTQVTPRIRQWRRLADWLAGLFPRLWTRVMRAVVRTQPARIVAAVRRQDLMLSIIAALGAMLVYVLQIYTSTWGSLIDYLSAIAAGFGAQAIVRWAALPIFESRQAKSKPGPAGE
ncbi:MAG: hypothetical protein ACHQHO_03590 [Solirubrobacterales bacterium]